MSTFFGDQLSDRQIFAAIQANGTVKDIGGAVHYTNLRNRWNYGAGLEHIPYLTGGIFYDTATVGGVNCFCAIDQVLERIYIDQASVFSQYPFDRRGASSSTCRRRDSASRRSWIDSSPIPRSTQVVGEDA